jgi:hypothetical protein
VDVNVSKKRGKLLVGKALAQAIPVLQPRLNGLAKLRGGAVS